jgi:hypothetical protein
MAKFDVDANPSESAAQETPNVVVVQRDLLDALSSSVHWPTTQPPAHMQLAASGEQFGTTPQHTDCGHG